MLSRRSWVLGGLVLAAVAVAQDGAVLAWKPAVGSVSKYRLTTTTNVQGQTANFGATMTMKIESIEGDKVKQTSTTGNISLKVGDMDMSEMMAQMVSTVTTTTSLTGEVLERKLTSGQAEFDSPKMENAFMMVYPGRALKAGETWTREVKSGGKVGFPASKGVFTYVGVEKLADKFNAHKIKFDFKELEGSTPMTAQGTVWIQVEDGALLKQDFTLKNAEVGPGMIADMTGQMLRIGYEPGK